MNKKNTPEWIKQIRAARRQVEIDLQIPKETSKIHKTSKKDRADRKSNTIRNLDLEV